MALRPIPGGADPRMLALTLGAVYLVWGASFLAIRILVVSQPPWAMAGSRFLIAGILVAGWARWRGAAWPDGASVRTALVASLFMFFGTYGSVYWAMQYLPSGFVALVMASIPVFVVLVERMRPAGMRAGRAVWFGLLVGLVGVAFLVQTGKALSELPGGLPLLPTLACVGGALSWATGTSVVLSRGRGASKLMMTGAQLTFGGVALLVLAFGAGEQVDLRAIWHPAPMAAYWFLVLGASLGTFLSYMWLLDHVRPAFASSYAYVNPLVAVVLGAWLLHEPVTTGMWIGGGLVVAAVVLVSVADRPEPTRPPGPAHAADESGPGHLNPCSTRGASP